MDKIEYSLHNHKITATVREIQGTWKTWEVQGRCPICNAQFTVGKKVQTMTRADTVANYKTSMRTHFKRKHGLK